MLLFCLSELNNNLYLDCLTVGQVVAFTDDGWRANLHGLHLVYDLICSVSQVCFLYLGISALVLAMVPGSCQLCLSISLVYIWEYYQSYSESFSFVSFIPAMLRIFQLPSY